MNKISRISIWRSILFAAIVLMIISAVMFLSLAFTHDLKRSTGHGTEFTVEESRARFAAFEGRLRETAESFGLELEMTSNSYHNEPSYRGVTWTYSIKTDESAEIKLSLSNVPMKWLPADEKGVEEFDISYRRLDPSAEISMELFTALVNCVSGQKLTAEDIGDAFLNLNDGSYDEIYEKTDSIFINRFDDLAASKTKWELYKEWAKQGHEDAAFKGSGYLDCMGIIGRASLEIKNP